MNLSTDNHWVEVTYYTVGMTLLALHPGCECVGVASLTLHPACVNVVYVCVRTLYVCVQ